MLLLPPHCHCGIIDPIPTHHVEDEIDTVIGKLREWTFETSLAHEERTGGGSKVLPKGEVFAGIP